MLMIMMMKKKMIKRSLTLINEHFNEWITNVSRDRSLSYKLGFVSLRNSRSQHLYNYDNP